MSIYSELDKKVKGSLDFSNKTNQFVISTIKGLPPNKFKIYGDSDMIHVEYLDYVPKNVYQELSVNATVTFYNCDDVIQFCKDIIVFEKKLDKIVNNSNKDYLVSDIIVNSIGMIQSWSENGDIRYSLPIEKKSRIIISMV
jgi:hypothetical protein